MYYKNSFELYEKLTGDFYRLMRYFDRDKLADFCIAAHSLCEWIPRDQSLSEHQKEQIVRYKIPRGINFNLCGQIANFVKHNAAQPRHKNNKSTLVITAIDVKEGGQPGTMFVHLPGILFGRGDSIRIEYTDEGIPHSESAMALVWRIYSFYQYIFEYAPINDLSERQNRLKLWPDTFLKRLAQAA